MLNTRERLSSLRRKESGKSPSLGVRSPRIRMVTPGNNFNVSGDVFILVDALSDHDPIGSLAVEIQIDGETVISAKYSHCSGYYGAIWDSSAERPGTMHTIIAKATDSVGKSKSTLVGVTVGQS